MLIPLKKIQWVEFHEHPISHPKNVKVELFEICSPGLQQSKEQQEIFNHSLYCKLLLEKVLSLNTVLLSRFLDFQFQSLDKPFTWLTSLDMLLEFNADVLIELKLGRQLNNALNIVFEKRAEYQQVAHFYREDDLGNENPYRFDAVKLQLDKLENYHSKKAFLLRMKTDYLQNKFKYDREDGVRFDKQIDLELSYLKKIKKMKLEEDFSLAPKPMVVIWELHQNVLIDFFYQSLKKKTPDGKRGIRNTKKFIEKFLSTHFASSDGKLFSPTTIRTVMTPSRYEKRPNAEDRIDLEEIIEKYKDEGLTSKNKTS